MAIIDEVTIKGFKSIQEQTVSLGQMNILIGTNGAGKSNFLEALAVLSASAEGGIDYQKLKNRGSRLSAADIFRSAFRNIPRKKFFELKAKMSDYEYDMKINSSEQFSYFSENLKEKHSKIAGRSYAGATFNNNSINKLDNQKSILGVIQSFEASYTPILENLKKFAIYSPSTPILRGVASDESYQEPLGLYGGGLAKALAELIKDEDNKGELQRFFKLFEWFQSIGTSTAINPGVSPEQSLVGSRIVKYNDKFMKTNFNELYAYDVSEGALFILFVLVLLIHKKAPNIFALDNVDSTLNPGLIRQLMIHIVEILEKHPEKQIFLTTHNPTTLDGIDLFNDQHRLFVVSRSDKGLTELKRIMPPKGMTKEEWEEKYFGLRLSEIWLSGAIGGMPKGF
ncbi:MAG: hypothetical protein A2023_06065 [Sulfuricurvum sp. GWF2_44_89]|uniref:ATPase AAA-type core domain-containing protein n=1 Tax=Sulfuricurvum kujiense TaxID=148813 RepID=A0A2D3WPJ4_9BACT|nr:MULTISPECIES: AAA family ATPase [Sulfuricurvum]OHD78307.1 MAG: hypothetical protein A2023_06065 [Sulfuricurvum sp. GWF2_44_89]OHD92009.1 MAG: hypothetical protein A2517_00615 [Sulfuricurvum sp. RIFOXYD12_FULL_44_77]DAB39179.1 MAG TPA: hypothetical protein CFH83_02075 [Sulfuricurvum kujiense]